MSNPTGYYVARGRKGPNYWPNFQGECRICGLSPTVNVPGHEMSETDLCGKHFFNDRSMTDWEEWNDQPEDSE